MGIDKCEKKCGWYLCATYDTCRHWLDAQPWEVREKILKEPKNEGFIFKGGKAIPVAKSVESVVKKAPQPNLPNLTPSQAALNRRASLQKMKERVVKRGKGYCYLCAQPLTQRVNLDHVNPKFYGGKDVFGNLMPVHPDCNSARGHRPLTSVQKHRYERLTGDTLPDDVMVSDSPYSDGIDHAGNWKLNQLTKEEVNEQFFNKMEEKQQQRYGVTPYVTLQGAKPSFTDLVKLP